MKDLILIDTSWVLHRMWYAHQDLQVTLHNGEVLKSGHLYGMCRLLKSLTSKYPAADIVCCLDGVAEHGKSLNADYKANRGASSVRTAFDDLGVVVECAVAFPRVRVAFHRSLEADEVIAYLARALFSLYRIRSVSPVETVLISAEDEGSYLAVRDSVNSNWRHPNSLKD